MRCACIDIGSNTTRLLVAELVDGALREVVSRRMFLPLVPSAGGAIPQETVSILAAVVAAHAATARDHGAHCLRAVATAAIRSAPNRDALCAAVSHEAGVEVSVLTTEQEARLAFAGATGTLADPPAGEVGVVDVGGGSSEIVSGTAAGGVTWYASLEVGSGLLTSRHVTCDPPSGGELDAIREDVRRTFAGLTVPSVEAAYAVGGATTSLRRLCGDELSSQTVDRALARLVALPVRDAAERLDLARERVRLLPAALLILAGASEALGGRPLRLTRGGLREGVILQDSTGAAAGS